MGVRRIRDWPAPPTQNTQGSVVARIKGPSPEEIRRFNGGMTAEGSSDSAPVDTGELLKNVCQRGTAEVVEAEDRVFLEKAASVKPLFERETYGKWRL